MAALIRVYLPTWRRPLLLRRALASLQAQTLQDWVCEVHNDDPLDSVPAQVAAECGDPRIVLIQHDRNLGAVASFNQFYRPCAEPYLALLEDDNRWCPSFLERLHGALEAHPQTCMVWCNQWLMEEQADGSVRSTGQTVRPWPVPEGERTQVLPFGGWEQVLGARHANGAMLLRRPPAPGYLTPAIPFDCVEPFRERQLPHPLLYLAEPLAEFTRTQGSARTAGHRAYGVAQTLLAASFLTHARLPRAELVALCAHLRAQQPPATGPLVASALGYPGARSVWQGLRAIDVWRFLKSALRRPGDAWAAVRGRQRHPDWWQALDQSTAARWSERRAPMQNCADPPD